MVKLSVKTRSTRLLNEARRAAGFAGNGRNEELVMRQNAVIGVSTSYRDIRPEPARSQELSEVGFPVGASRKAIKKQGA